MLKRSLRAHARQCAGRAGWDALFGGLRAAGVFAAYQELFAGINQVSAGVHTDPSDALAALNHVLEHFVATAKEEPDGGAAPGVILVDAEHMPNQPKHHYQHSCHGDQLEYPTDPPLCCLLQAPSSCTRLWHRAVKRTSTDPRAGACH